MFCDFPVNKLSMVMYCALESICEVTKEAKPIRSREYCVTLQMFSTDLDGVVHGDIRIYGASKLIL